MIASDFSRAVLAIYLEMFTTLVFQNAVLLRASCFPVVASFACSCRGTVFPSSI